MASRHRKAKDLSCSRCDREVYSNTIERLGIAGFAGEGESKQKNRAFCHICALPPGGVARIEGGFPTLDSPTKKNNSDVPSCLDFS